MHSVLPLQVAADNISVNVAAKTIIVRVDDAFDPQKVVDALKRAIHPLQIFGKQRAVNRVLKLLCFWLNGHIVGSWGGRLCAWFGLHGPQPANPRHQHREHPSIATIDWNVCDHRND